MDEYTHDDWPTMMMAAISTARSCSPWFAAATIPSLGMLTFSFEKLRRISAPR